MSAWASLYRRFSNRLKRKNTQAQQAGDTSQTAVMPSTASVPGTQTVLLLHGPRQPYQLVDDYPVPQVRGEHEVLVRTQSIGLNPIDWKAPDFNFAIPTLPYISGRELAGDVIQTSSASSRVKVGDRVIAISTDYRDLRKAAYQQHVVTFDYNAVRLPPRISYEEGATLGVAFVAAALALGICMGVDFSDVEDGPNLLEIVKSVDPESIPADVRDGSLNGISEQDRARPGDWLAIWGGSATSANLTVQLARLAGLKIATVVDTSKHGLRLSNHALIRPDLLVDSHDPQRAVAILQSQIGDSVRFGIDTRGKDTAASLLEALTKSSRLPPSPPATPRASSGRNAHLIGLTGVPKQIPEGVVAHSVPIKLFHEVPAVGRALVGWLERLLEKGLVSPTEIIDIEEGLSSVNTGLDRMRRGEISGGKLVVRLPEAEH